MTTASWCCPREFIPAAERYNVISAIDRWVLGQAIELLRARQRRGAPLPLLAVNLSGTSLNEQSFVDFVLQSVSDPQIAAALCFEITETAAVTSLANARYLMSELKVAAAASRSMISAPGCRRSCT